MPLKSACFRVLLATLVLVALAAAQQDDDDDDCGCGCEGFSDLLSDEFSEYSEELQLDEDENSSSNSTSSGQHEYKPQVDRQHFDEHAAEDLRAIVLNLAKRNEMLTEKIDKFPRMMKRVYKSAAAAASARERENKPPVNVAAPVAQPQYPNEKIIIVKSKSRSRSKSSDSSSKSKESSETESSSSSKSESSTNLSKELNPGLTNENYNAAALDTFPPYPAASKRYNEPRHRRRKYEQQERKPLLVADDYKDVEVQDSGKSHYGSMNVRPRYKQRGYSFKYERKFDVYDSSRRSRNYQQGRRTRYDSEELHRHKGGQERGSRSHHDHYTPSRYKDKVKHRGFS